MKASWGHATILVPVDVHSRLAYCQYLRSAGVPVAQVRRIPPSVLVCKATTNLARERALKFQSLS